ncbi:glycosyltransferase [Parabacteroides sp. AF17-28]|uniref:glycosyltransferase n=1 Tax=Parabacteroides sp. AF17-28 TaxID=2292241 RepID=UPI000F00B8A5|nr:glycosyltransferase [Parabacteroides sp. AF17-28]RHR53626.1 glycosyltransferase [Parabacteroides sp. AF17-28]
MKVVFLNTSERVGGAAVAASRLEGALRQTGILVSKLIRRNTWLNRFRFYWERLIIFLSNHLSRAKLFTVSIANVGEPVYFYSLIKKADVIHFHWINQGFLSLKGIEILTGCGKPIVWTMHDMWPCTAICHYSWGCERFHDECGKCPFLKSNKQRDLSHYVWRKKYFLKTSGIQLVAVSSWLAEQARKSSLTKDLDVVVIPNAIDISVFSKKEKIGIRKKLSFPLDKKIVLMGAARLDDPIKGFQFLKEALSILFLSRDDLLLVLFGAIKNDKSFFDGLVIPYLSLGLLSDSYQIAELYSAADVTVVPSFYETFGQTIIEAMACGCPAVSFNNSGQTDIIDHKINGYLAEYKNANDLANGIQWILNNPNPQTLSDACVKKVQESYTEEVVAKQYIALYEKLLQKNSDS